MNEYFKDFYDYEGFGPPIKATKADQITINSYKRKLPNRLIEYWKKYGFCGWGDGILWVVNPEDYSEVLKKWLDGSHFAEREKAGIDKYHVFARGAFGRLFVWGETSGQSIKINPLYGMLIPSDESTDLINDGPDMLIDLFFASSSKSDFEEEDEAERPLFESALRQLGPLESDEMYTFVPALALGGTNKLENLRKVKVIEHLNFLADLGEKRVMADIVAMSNELHKK